MSEADIAVAAPPELPQAPSSGLLVRVLLPVIMCVATVGVMAAGFLSRSTVTPTFVAFPVMMLASVVVTAVTGRGRRYGAELDTNRVDYLAYLSGLRESVTEIAVAQRVSLNREHPEPDMLWTLIGGPGMWRWRHADPNFCHVRVGVGTRPLAARLIEPETPPAARSDPVTATALRHFVGTYSTISDAPVAIPLGGIAGLTIDGDAARVRGLVRAMVCQLAVLHGPDELLIVGAVSERNRAQWDWLKWLPHNQHPDATDALGPVRMVYPSPAEAQRAAAAAAAPHAVVIVDADERAGGDHAGVTTLAVGAGRDGAPVTIRHPGEAEVVVRPDQLDLADALACARRLAAYRFGAPAVGRDGCCDPITLWHSQPGHERLSVPIGITVDGTPLRLDIKEAAENGMGPHGLCVGATGSGKSELLRTVALGMMARNSPEVLNLLLIDFKGGATFLDLARAPHVSAVITNLADEAPLVARMKDALTGEMNRRQQLLRTAGNFVSVAAYEGDRRAGAQLAALPTLFIIVDEFSELFSQHPDLADVFVAIGRLGRSLGMHLLLASQRLDEGRLRGLEAHLSYRICLKTLSASESRTVLGTLDAYELPSTPGAGFLRSATGELIGFRAAFVSGPFRTRAGARPAAVPSVRRFTTHAAGPVAHAGADDTGAAPARTVLHAVLDRLTGQGPPAHQVWLPPLETVALDTLLREVEGAPALAVPIGLVDRPFEQCRAPLIVDLSGAAGHVAVVGAPQSGKSTALRTLITALAATHDAGRVQFYCLDFGGGALASMRALPHVGAVAGRGEPQLVWRIVAELESLVRSRDRSEPDAFADVFLVIDGWASLRHEFEALEESITTIAVQGLSFGVHVVLSASRWAEIRPALRDQIGTRIELRLGEPADSELDRKQAQRVPHDTPGRGLSRDGLHMMIALPGPVEVESVPGLVAPPIPLLPTRVDYDIVIERADERCGANILLGIEERRLQPVAVDFARHRHLLIIGDNECGKTTALRVLCREIVRTKTAAQAQLFIVDFRRTLLGAVESEQFGGYAMSPAALDELLPGVLHLLRDRMPPPHVTPAQLRTRSWWSGPDVYVVVDDYDLVVTSAGNPLSAILEYLPHAGDVGLHLIVARRSGGAARALFEPLLAGLRDLGCMTLMMSGRPDDGVLFGSVHPAPLPPGRGLLVARPGDEQRVQVAWCPPP